MKDSLRWWQDSRFGMFIHFGIYAVSEGKWKGEEVPGLVEWMQCKRQIPIAEYSKFAKGLTLEHFDPEKYVMLAKAAGMKYVVFTAKHHDGFAMYDSKCSDYNVVKMCPSHKDVARELANEVRKAGLKMCFYYSQALDWEDPDAFGNTWDFLEEKKYRRFLDGKCKNQLKELLTEYGDIGLIWFDMPGGMSREESLELKAYVKQLQPDCLVSGRINMDPSVGDYGSMGDNEFPSGKLEGSWETPATLNNTWGYRKTDLNWKSPEEQLRLMIELLSKGMNYLLNIGPMPDGDIPEESVKILTKMGEWVQRNQEAVYGTSATPYQFDFPWGRISQKENMMYIYLLEPTKSFQIPGIKNRVLNVSVLTDEGRVKAEYRQEKWGDETLVTVQVPPTKNPYFDVVRIELEGRPEVRQGLYELPEGLVNIYSHMAKLETLDHDLSLQTENDESDIDIAAERHNVWDNMFCIDPNGNIRNWFSPQEYASWDFEIKEPGDFEVFIQTRSMKYTPWVGGHKVSIQMDNMELTKVLAKGEKVVNAHSRYFDERLTSLGTVRLNCGGKKHIILRLLECNPQEKAGLLVTRIMLKRL